MTDLGSIIEHDVTAVGSATFGFEELSLLRERKRRMQRIGTVAVALVIAAASLGVASRLLRSAEPRQPAVPTTATTRGIWAVDLDSGATSLIWGPGWLNEELGGAIRGAGVGVPDVSSDGSRLVVTVERDFLPFQIYTLRSDGSDLTRITDCEPPFSCPLGLGVHGPRWSPDGSVIAFVGGPNTRENASDIYVVDANGDGLRRVVHVAGEQDAVDWSPNGTELVFDSESAEIYRASIEGGPPTRLARGGSDPLWSPDGRWIAFLGFGDRSEGIWLMRPDGNGATFLATGDLPVDWSPDGREILVRQASPDTLEEKRGEVRTHRYAIVDVQTGASRTLDVRAIEGAVFVFRWPASQP
jgi:Tol biopolymer transport system component